jgi:LmbE family N-acetylglucosaminyl deacetylase
MDAYPPLKPKVVLGVAAHPDDLDLLDFGSTGTMAKFAANGASVHLLIVSDGGKGTHDYSLTTDKLVKIRHNEQQAALKAIGGRAVHFLDYPDAEIEFTLDLKKDIVRVIRQLKPDVVIALDPTFIYSAEHGIINHPDHRIVGQATLDAVYPLARDYKSFPDLLQVGYEPHEVQTVLLANFNQGNYHVDITDTLSQKLASLAAHKSQLEDIKAWQARVKRAAKQCGQAHGCTYAECFMRIDITNP